MSDHVAIIGMAGRFPGAQNIEEFWRNLRDGVESIRRFTVEELIEAGVSEDLIHDPAYVKAGAPLANADCFDAAFFGYQPKEARVMDPQHRLFLESAWAALEDAGHDPERYGGAIGVFGGVAHNTYLVNNLVTNPEFLSTIGEYQLILATDKDYPATRVAYKLGLTGPALSVQTACSTSGVAVHLACQSLLTGDCDMALAGGGRVHAPIIAGYRYEEGSTMSPDGRCRAFDAEAKGMVRGSGMAFVVLKRLEDALEDHDHVYAVIKGSAINNDGSGKVGFTAPSVNGQAAVIGDALAAADLAAESIGYVEAHGTGTALGDPIEVAALTKAFRETTDKAGFCALGSVKTNIGHLDAGAGVAGIIKAALALEREQIPPSLHYTKPNPQIDFDGSPFYVNASLKEWKRGKDPRRAGVSSFGLGGTNAHVVLEEAPASEPSSDSRSHQLLLLSAKSSAALERATDNLAAHLEHGLDINLADVAYTLQTGRRRFEHRRALVCQTAASAVQLLRTPGGAEVPTQHNETSNRRVVFMFPGQGSQYPNMGRDLYRKEPLYRELIDRCVAELEPMIGFDLRDVLFPEPERTEWAAEQLKQVAITSPSVFVTSYALARLWMSWGIEPSAMIGHSLGQYVAACLSGVFSLSDALTTVATRGRLMQEMPSGAMLGVPLSETEVMERLSADLSLASVNAPSATVVSGTHEAIARFAELLKGEGIACRTLHTSHAYHSAMMDPVLAPFARAVSDAKPTSPRIPFSCNVTGKWITDTDACDPEYWAGHIRRPVRFAEGMGTLLDEIDPVLLEVGPGRTLSTFALKHPKRTSAHTVVSSLRHPSEPTSDTEFQLRGLGRLWIGGVTVDWEGFYADERRKRTPLPTYPFERKRFWVEPQVAVPRAAASTASEVEPEDVDVSPEAVAHRPQTKKDKITQIVTEVLCEISGLEPTELNPTTSFLELGFESLSLTQVAAALKARIGAEVTLQELLQSQSTLHALSEHLDSVLAEHAFSELPVSQRSPVTDTAPVEIPLTEEQLELWVASQLGPEASCAYNLTSRISLRGSLHSERLLEAIQSLIERYEALRTTFGPDGALQRVHASLRVDIPIVDLSMHDSERRGLEIEALAKHEAETPFDLVSGPLVRGMLIRLTDDEHLLFLTAHHVICDGWSWGVLLRNLGESYSAACDHRAPRLKEVMQLREYVSLREAGDERAKRAADQEFWVSQFAEVPPPLDLPTDYPRPRVRTVRAQRTARVLAKTLSRRLRTGAVGYGTTQFALLLAGFQTLLHRLTGQTDLVVGTAAAGQARFADRDIVGHCVSFLPVRTTINPELPARDQIAATTSAVFDAHQHQQCTLGALLQRLGIGRDPSRLPLVSVAFNMDAVTRDITFHDLAVTVQFNPRRFENYELVLNCIAGEQGITLLCTYNADLFKRETIDRWLGHYETLLGAMLDLPDQPLYRLPALSEVEQQQVVVEWNDTQQPIQATSCVHEMFEAQVERTPNELALVFGQQRWTYRELNARSNRIAHALRRRGVESDTPVGLFVRRSPEMIAGILGILKAGGAYVPMEPTAPANRLRHKITDTAMPLALTQPDLAARLLELQAHVLVLDDAVWRGDEPEKNPLPTVTLDDLAYVMYTSGSTGVPKGVLVTHRNLLHSTAARTLYYDRPVGTFLLLSSFAFDSSVAGIFWTLTQGGAIVVPEPGTERDVEHVERLIDKHGVTHLLCLPSLYSLVLETASTSALRSLETVIVAGESCSGELARRHAERLSGVALYNEFGPTETTVWATAYRVDAQSLQDGVPIGRPIPNGSAYVLDAFQQPVPIGVVGEIYLGGAGVARGYLKQPALTASRFLPDPFRGSSAGRMYRTGDLGRYRPDGNLEFVGRIDDQVKLRGYRVELGDVEAALAQHAAVAQVAALVREDSAGDQRLVAYAVLEAGSTVDTADLRSHLHERLPEFMLPQHIVLLESLPLTSRGKVNRAALPEPERATGSGHTYVAPRSTTEEVLAECWRELLGVEQVGVNDNFFDMGGHSLLAIRLMTRLRERLQIDLELRTVFEAPTVAEIAAIVEDKLINEIDQLTDQEAERLAAVEKGDSA